MFIEFIFHIVAAAALSVCLAKKTVWRAQGLDQIVIIEFSFILQKRKEKKKKERKREREEILTLLKREEEYDEVSSLAEQAA